MLQFLSRFLLLCTTLLIFSPAKAEIGNSVFALTKTDIETITIQSTNQSIELLTNAQIETALNQQINELEIYCGTKKIAKDKCDEVFDLIKEDCSISTYDVWHSFSTFLDQIKKK